jgi:pyridoxal phosphate enzyme (YggS family)
MASVTDQVRDRAPVPIEGQLASSVARQLAVARARIAAAGGDLAAVTIVAVTKGFGVAAVRAARTAGLCDVGDNYAQELLDKFEALGDEHPESAGGGLRWHFLGPVQRNKVAALAAPVDCWQTVDRLAAGEAIARRRPGARILVQVNASGEATKHGCRPDGAGELVAQLRRLPLQVSGLMTIGPAGPPEGARPIFRQVAALGRKLGLTELSMGMTNDLEVAIQEGATMVRIGRGLFGPRGRTASPATVGS